MNTDTVTGKEALLAILEGLYWYESETVPSFRLKFCEKTRSFTRQTLGHAVSYKDYAPWEDRYFVLKWTRSEPVELEPLT